MEVMKGNTHLRDFVLIQPLSLKINIMTILNIIHLDNLEFVNAEQIIATLDVYMKLINKLESFKFYRSCNPFVKQCYLGITYIQQEVPLFSKKILEAK